MTIASVEQLPDILLGFALELLTPFNGYRNDRMHRTLDEIRREGLAALRERLGRSGLIQFLEQFDLGAGDYAKERRDWVDQTSLDEIKRLAAKRPTKKRKPAKKRPRRRT